MDPPAWKLESWAGTPRGTVGVRCSRWYPWYVADNGQLPSRDPLAERALEVLVTHNEAVSRDDLACALGVSGAEAWEIAANLQSLGRATLDEKGATVTAVEPPDSPR